MINLKFLSIMLLHPQKAFKPLCTEIDPLYILYRVSQNYVNTNGLYYHLFPAKCVSGL